MTNTVHNTIKILMSNVIVVDVETNGLPLTRGFNNYYDPKNTIYYDTSRMIELGYIIYSFDGKEIARREFLIKPDKFNITNSDIHGITFDMANAGLDIRDAFDIFEIDLLDADRIVAHNVSFDLNVILAECYRYDRISLIDRLTTIKKECTMAMGKEYLKSGRFPALKVLYKTLTNQDVEQQHRALDDSRLCGECYFALKALNAIAIADEAEKKIDEKIEKI